VNVSGKRCLSDIFLLRRTMQPGVNRFGHGGGGGGPLKNGESAVSIQEKSEVLRGGVPKWMLNHKTGLESARKKRFHGMRNYREVLKDLHEQGA